jgi:hypothetical protein
MKILYINQYILVKSVLLFKTVAPLNSGLCIQYVKKDLGLGLHKFPINLGAISKMQEPK